MSTYTPRDWESISEDLLSWVQGNPDLVDGVLPTDLRVGSLERAHMEAVAIGLEDVEYRFSRAIPEAISESCYRAFGFDLLPGVAAVGSVVFGSYSAAASNVTIPQGTVVMTRGSVQFVTTAAGEISIGTLASGSVPVIARETGVAGNVPAGSIVVLPYPVPGVDSVSNPSGTLGGKGIESDADRAKRFQRYILTLPRGTAPALEYAAMSVPSVVDAKTVEPFALPAPPELCPYAGLAWLWVDAGQSGVLAPGVLADITRKLRGYTDEDGVRVEGWKAAGVRVDVKASTHVPVKVAATFTLAEGARSRFQSEIVPILNAIVLEQFTDLRIGENVTHNALLVALATASADIVGISLKLWRSDEDEPTTDVPADVPIVDDSQPLSSGNRATLVSGAVIEAGETVTYPRWSMS